MPNYLPCQTVVQRTREGRPGGPGRLPIEIDTRGNKALILTLVSLAIIGVICLRMAGLSPFGRNTHILYGFLCMFCTAAPKAHTHLSLKNKVRRWIWAEGWRRCFQSWRRYNQSGRFRQSPSSPPSPCQKIPARNIR